MYYYYALLYIIMYYHVLSFIIMYYATLSCILIYYHIVSCIIFVGRWLDKCAGNLQETLTELWISQQQHNMTNICLTNILSFCNGSFLFDLLMNWYVVAQDCKQHVGIFGSMIGKMCRKPAGNSNGTANFTITKQTKTYLIIISKFCKKLQQVAGLYNYIYTYIYIALASHHPHFAKPQTPKP